MRIANEILHVQTRRHIMPSNTSQPESKTTTLPAANNSYTLTDNSFALTGTLCYEITPATTTTTTQLKPSSSLITKNYENSYKISDKSSNYYYKLNLINKLMHIDGIKYLNKMQSNCDLTQQKPKPKQVEQKGVPEATPFISPKEHIQKEEAPALSPALPLHSSELSNEQQQQHTQHTTTPQLSTLTPTTPSTSSALSSFLCLLFLHLPQQPQQHLHTRPLSSLQLSLLLCFLLIAQIGQLPSILAAPQSSCIYCREEDLKAQQQQQQQITVQHLKDGGAAKNYEEFLFEHQVTRKDAIAALKALNETFYLGPAPESACKSVVCSKKVMNYCLGPQFINDHCWCELGHTEEGLPYVPHICYVGEKVYTASVGSCFFYEEVKECCCAPALATQYRHISAGSMPKSQYLIILLLLSWPFLLKQLQRVCY